MFIPSLVLATVNVLPATAATSSQWRIFVTTADLPQLRARAADTKKNALGYVAADEWKTLLAKADKFVAAPPYHYAVNMPGREGGPSKRWEYTLSDAPPPRHDDYSHWPPWTAMFQERDDSLTTRLKYLLAAFVVTDRPKYFERAKQIVMHLCAWPGIWTDPSYGGGKPCLDTGHAAAWVSVFYDWCDDQLTEPERRRVRQALIDKALLPIDKVIDNVAPYHNYTAVIANGLCLGGIALSGEDDRAAGWIDHAIRRLTLNFDAQGKDGGPMEGPMYGTYAANQFADTIWALTTAGVDNKLVTHHYLRTLPRYCVAMLNPNNHQVPCFGDGGPGVAFVNLMLALAVRGDSDAAWYCQQADQLRADTVRKFLLLDPQRIRPKQPARNPSDCFVDVGYASLRTGYKPGGAFMAFKCGPPTAEIGHNHYDHNSFVINYAGTWIAWDPGYRNYFEPRERKYTTSTFGHNSIVVDLDDAFLRDNAPYSVGHTQVHLNRAHIAEYFTSEAFDYVMGEAAGAYNNDKVCVLDQFDRHIVYAKPRVFFMFDTLAAPQRHTFSFMLHAARDAAFEIEEDQVRLVSTGGYLQVFLCSPQGLQFSTGLYAGAEVYGPYLAATTRRVSNARFIAALVPRRHSQLVVNPGFESGMIGWKPRNLPGWKENHHIDTEVKHGGKGSARIDGPGGYYYSRRFAARPGTKLVARWWAKCSAPTGASSIFYFWRGGKYFRRALGPAAKDNAWRQYKLTAVVPEGAEEACLALQFFGKGQCWYDDVEIAAENAPPPPAPAVASSVGDGNGIVVNVDGETYVMLLGAQTAVVKGQSIECTAPLAVVHLEGDHPKAFVRGPGALKIGGKAIPCVNGKWPRGLDTHLPAGL